MWYSDGNAVDYSVVAVSRPLDGHVEHTDIFPGLATRTADRASSFDDSSDITAEYDAAGQRHDAKAPHRDAAGSRYSTHHQ